MQTGTQQKLGIRVDPGHRGERLVIGISLAAEGGDSNTELVVRDPDEEPITEIRKGDVPRAEEIMKRLSLARALNLTGFPQTGFEIAWPEGLSRTSPEMEFLSQAERKSLSRSAEDRSRAFQEEIYSEMSAAPRRLKGDFLTQEVRFDLPPIELDPGKVITSILCRRGVRKDVLLELAQAKQEVREAASDRVKAIPEGDQAISFREEGNSTRVEYGGYFFSELVFE